MYLYLRIEILRLRIEVLFGIKVFVREKRFFLRIEIFAGELRFLVKN